MLIKKIAKISLGLILLITGMALGQVEGEIVLQYGQPDFSYDTIALDSHFPILQIAKDKSDYLITSSNRELGKTITAPTLSHASHLAIHLAGGRVGMFLLQGKKNVGIMLNLEDGLYEPVLEVKQGVPSGGILRLQFDQLIQAFIFATVLTPLSGYTLEHTDEMNRFAIQFGLSAEGWFGVFEPIWPLAQQFNMYRVVISLIHFRRFLSTVLKDRQAISGILTGNETASINQLLSILDPHGDADNAMQ